MSRSADPTAALRVASLVRGARLVDDPASELGRRVRRELVAATGLSSEGVELAFAECLETGVSKGEIRGFCASVEPAPRAHVVLSANVFVAAHRAVALGLAASARVFVRPSRRESVFARALAEAAPGLFEITNELEPAPGDAVWAYGTDETLAEIRTSLPLGVRFHAHGSGFGVAVVDASHANPEIARALALDVVPFDQRGCLSPRAVVFLGTDSEARAFAELVASELALAAERIPLGALASDEAAEITRFRDALTYAGATYAAGPGWVGVGVRDALVVAPVGRNLAVTPSDDPRALLAPRRSSLAALGLAVGPELAEHLRNALPGARPSAFGAMQRPPFDGPVDRRAGDAR